MAAGTVVALTGPSYGVSDDHGVGAMGSATDGRAMRTVAVDPKKGPDFEMPFVCGQTWTGSSRASHSPSPYSIDWNRTGDEGSPALASARGVVSRVAVASGYGNYVIVDHGGGWTTLYAHLQSTQAAVGQVVDQGAIVGRVGHTGNVTGPHLHFEERLNGAYFPPYFHRTTFKFGSTMSSLNCPDIPVTGDWDGNGITDVGVFRPAVAAGQSRFILLADGVRTEPKGAAAGATPVIGDWDGDGRSQLGWRLMGSSDFVLRGQEGGESKANMGGLPRDLPVSGDWTTQPKSGLGVYHQDTTKLTWRMPDMTRRTAVVGGSGQQPVTGDWNGDGVDDPGTYEVATGTWRLRKPNGTVTTIRYGQSTDLPVVGDWDGNGIDEVGVWRPSTGTFMMRRTDGAIPFTRTTKLGWPRG